MATLQGKSCGPYLSASAMIQVRYRKSPRCPDPNARIQKFIHYMAIVTFAIADCHLCDEIHEEELYKCSAFIFFYLYGSINEY